MSIINTTLTTIASNVYASSGNNAITTMYFCNNSASTVTFNLYAVPSGSLPDGNTQIYSQVQLASNDTYIIDFEKLILSNGDTIRANASANTAVVSTISYIGI